MFPLLNTQHVLALDELLTHVSSGGELVLFERVTWFVRSGRGGGVYNREMFLLAQWVVDCVPHKNAIYSTLLSTTTAPAPEWLQTEHIISFAVTKKQNIPAIFLYRFYKKVDWWKGPGGWESFGFTWQQTRTGSHVWNLMHPCKIRPVPHPFYFGELNNFLPLLQGQLARKP